MDIVMICGLCITAAFLCKVVEKDSREFSIAISLAVVTIIILSVITEISQISETVTELFEQADIPSEYPKIIFKALGVCYITQIGSDCCRDCGENSLATAAETAGKISVLIIALPAFRALSVIIQTLLER